MMLSHRFPLWSLILSLMDTLPCVGQFNEVPLITDPVFIEDCVSIHNKLRSKIRPVAGGMKRMSWDAALAKSARAWARKCEFSHNTHIGKKQACHPNFNTVGENIWMGRLTYNVPKNATLTWFKEGEFYDLGTNDCLKPCGHYTQVIWSSTYKIGCAVRECPHFGKDIVIFVCNYAPAGNTYGRRPYEKGYSCDYCDKEDCCEDNLCTNRIRDKSISYPYWNPSWEIPRHITCNEFCQKCLIARGIGLAIIIIGVFIVQLKFPGLHLRT